MRLKIRAIVLILVLVFSVAAGCGRSRGDREQSLEVPKETIEETVAESYRDIYEQAEKKGSLNDFSTKREIVERLGKSGHVAVDAENQVNMKHAEKLRDFVLAAKAKDRAKVTVFCVEGEGSFTRYNLATEDGEIRVERMWVAREEHKPEVKYEETYRAYRWEYSKDGYLFFEKYQPEGYHGPMSYTCLRVQPLEDKYREMNRKYIQPVGYAENNLFFLNWTEQEYGAVNFDDLFRLLYPAVYGESIPYTMASDTWGIGKRYRIAQEEYEQVVQSFFKIASQEIQQRGTYFSKDNTYEFRPRAYYDMELPEEMAYSEVIGCREHRDGTRTLTVNAVYPARSSTKVLTHEVTVRDKEGGGFEYVSNKILFINKELVNTWHRERLTRERWEELYPEVEEG